LTGDLRAEVRDWLAAHVPATPLPSVDTAEGFGRHRDWERELFAARLAVVSWPAEYGGRDLPLLDWLVFEEEYHAAGGPVRVGQNGLFLLAPTLFAHGTPEQRDRLLPRMARADDVWAQAWSEPEAGSDLAAIRARADRVAGGWRLTGSKTWSSRAAFADRAFGLFRSEPVDLDAERRPGAGGSGGGPPGKQSGGSSPRAGTLSTGTRTVSSRRANDGAVLAFGMLGVSRTAARSSASRSVPRKWPATNSTRAPLRLITSSASWPVNRVLTGTSVPPVPSAPSAASTQ
jgi:hypothetical protein